MAIRPLRIRTTKEDVKNFKKSLRQANFQNKLNQTTRGKLSKYILISLVSIGSIIIIMRHIFVKLSKTNTKDE